MKRILAAALTAAFALSSNACGGDGSANRQDGLEEVTLGIAPVAASAIFQVGADQGFFREESIDLEITIVQGGSAVLPGVVANKPQFATSNAVTLLTAGDQDVPVKIVSNASADNLAPAKGAFGVVAGVGTGIKTTADLAGKTVAVNTLKGLGDFTVGEAVRNAGGDPDRVKYVELAFPDMAAVLKKGDVDAVWVPEPYLTQLTGEGLGHLVGYTTQESLPGLASYVFTSAKTDKELVERMTRALNKTLEYADDHTAEVQKAAVDLTGLSLEAIEAGTMGAFGPDLREDAFRTAAELMEDRGWIEDGDAAAALVLP